MYPLPKAVIFDLDGTLLDTIDDLADSCNHALDVLGHPPHPTDAYFYFVGDGIAVLAQRILPMDSPSEDEVSECVDLIATHYDGNWQSKTSVYNGIPKLLSRLQSLHVVINVLSNKNEGTVQAMVSHFIGNINFEYVAGATPDYKKKPDPKRALSLAEILQLAPADIMFIGDSKVDMQTAENAGMTSVGVTWGFRTRQELVDHNAKIIIDSPEEFWNHVQES